MNTIATSTNENTERLRQYPYFLLDILKAHTPLVITEYAGLQSLQYVQNNQSPFHQSETVQKTQPLQDVLSLRWHEYASSILSKKMV